MLTMKYKICALGLILISLVFIVQSCAGSKKWKKHLEGPIVFGSMGGFVGSFDEYTIQQDGSVYYRKSLKGESNMVQKLDEDLKKEIFERIKSNEIYNETIDEPGNMTYFIKFNYKSESHRLQWGGQHDPSESLLDYYNFLKSNIKGKSPVM